MVERDIRPSTKQPIDFTWVLDEKMTFRVLRSFETDRPEELVLKEEKCVRVRKRLVKPKGESGEEKDRRTSFSRRYDSRVSSPKKLVKTRKNSGNVAEDLLPRLVEKQTNTSSESFLKELAKGFPVDPPATYTGRREVKMSKVDHEFRWKLGCEADSSEDAIDETEDYRNSHELECPLCPYGIQQDRIAILKRLGILLDPEQHREITKAIQKDRSITRDSDSTNSFHITEAHQTNAEPITPADSTTSNITTLLAASPSPPTHSRPTSQLIETSSNLPIPPISPILTTKQSTNTLRRTSSDPLPQSPLAASSSQPLTIRKTHTRSLIGAKLKRRASDAASDVAVQAQGWGKKVVDGLLRSVGKRRIERVGGGVVVWRSGSERWDLDGDEIGNVEGDADAKKVDGAVGGKRG